MDFGKLLVEGQQVKFATQDHLYQGTVVQSSCMDYERKYLIRFEDGSTRWVNQSMVRHLFTSN